LNRSLRRQLKELKGMLVKLHGFLLRRAEQAHLPGGQLSGQHVFLHIPDVKTLTLMLFHIQPGCLRPGRQTSINLHAHDPHELMEVAMHPARYWNNTARIETINNRAVIALNKCPAIVRGVENQHLQVIALSMDTDQRHLWSICHFAVVKDKIQHCRHSCEKYARIYKLSAPEYKSILSKGSRRNP